MKPARILVLLVALCAGGIAAWLTSGSDPIPVVAPPPVEVVQIETVDVLVAGVDILIGTAITARELKWQIWPTAAAGPQFIRKADRPDAMEQLAGSLTRQPFYTGEPIREARLIRAQGSGYMAAILPQGMRAISMEVSPESGAGGFILPNDHVDIILSRRYRDSGNASSPEMYSSTTVLSNLRVLAIDQTIEEKNGQRVVVGRTATLEVAPSQAETLTRAKLMGSLFLALRSIVDFEGKDGNVEDPQDSQRGINMVRFGITAIANVK
jgi:pilus assembly protein CpaB